jgi:hypothetical protein
MIPGVLLGLTAPDTLEIWQSVPATRVGLPVFGGVLICLGLADGRHDPSVRYGRQGTPAPWNPTQKLVVQGVYRQPKLVKQFGADYLT